MRIQHNIPAMNAYRNYSSNTKSLSKNLEKLSSGYKINRAGDDAAGLAISEKMRAQITGLKAAQKNAKDGISLVQTAEGALTEVHSMLNRMVDLADQSANGTFDDTTDRANLQKEITALKSEVDRIADATNFNGIKLLDGSLKAGSMAKTLDVGFTGTVAETVGVTASKPAFSIDLDGFSLTGTAATNKSKVSLTVGGVTVEGDELTAKVGVHTSAEVAASFAAKTVQIGDVTYTAAVTGSKLTFTADIDPVTATDAKADFAVSIALTTAGDAAVTGGARINPATQVITTGKVAKGAIQASTSFQLTADMLKEGQTIKIGGDTFTFKVDKDSKLTGANVIDLSTIDPTSTTFISEAADKVTAAFGGNAMFTVGNNGGTISLQSKAADTTTDFSTAAKVEAEVSIGSSKTTSPLTLQIGEDSQKYNQLDVTVGSMKTTDLGIDGIDIGNQTGAQTAVDLIRKAINQVSSTRGDLGATQNRLDHTINNLSVMAENIQDAEANIRDVDVAEEMMAYTKNNILVQSAQAMLAQANQLPQGVLQLLQ